MLIVGSFLGLNFPTIKSVPVLLQRPSSVPWQCEQWNRRSGSVKSQVFSFSYCLASRIGKRAIVIVFREDYTEVKSYYLYLARWMVVGEW